ncbi:metallophosphoesterase [Phytobacter sp. V91]|uniref:metallophosphoesterase n=1 Tax=Phytobacter sp. V91 TaxID=3369425 RepID=UPI003F5F269F
MIIAQISDIHAGPDNENLSRLDRALAWLDQIQPDALVISGDLIDDDWFEGYQSIAEKLGSRPYPGYILPGNSDNREQMRLVFGDNSWCKNALPAACHFVADLGQLRLIGLDTTIKAESAGAVAQHLEWLNDNLPTEASTMSVLFLHHHVIESGIAPMDHIMCRDSAKLEAFLNHHPQRPAAISTGHVHRPVMGIFAGIPTYICGSICPANPLWFGTDHIPAINDPAYLMIHLVRKGSLVSHHIAV